MIVATSRKCQFRSTAYTVCTEFVSFHIFFSAQIWYLAHRIWQKRNNETNKMLILLFIQHLAIFFFESLFFFDTLIKCSHFVLACLIHLDRIICVILWSFCRFYRNVWKICHCKNCNWIRNILQSTYFKVAKTKTDNFNVFRNKF